MGILSRYLATWMILILMSLQFSCQSNSRISPLNSQLNNPLRPTDVSEPVSTPLPRPKPGTGIIVGVMKIRHTDQPMVGVELYLARHIGVTPDTPLYTMELDNAPHAITDANGRFIFKDVPPGRYAIVIWNPISSFLVRNPATGLELVIDVQPDQIHNLGVLFESQP